MATSSLSAMGMGCRLGRSKDVFPDAMACVTRVPGWGQAQLLPRDALRQKWKKTAGLKTVKP